MIHRSHLVAAKLPLRISPRYARPNTLRKLVVKKLRSKKEKKTSHSPLILGVVPLLTSATLADCVPTSAHYCGNTLVSSTHANERIRRSIARQLQREMLHTRKHCSPPLREAMSRTIEKGKCIKGVFPDASRASRE